MGFFKKTFIFILIILFISSVYKDLTVGTPVPGKDNGTAVSMPEKPEQSSGNKQKETDAFQILEVKVHPGDTVLTIVEDINRRDTQLSIEQVIKDFQTLNPDADPHQIEPDMIYKFPVYNNQP
ncbi:hypothetical protein [Sediminibacillus albus]|uniref:LysM domain-containing protein n=1 Tax=Sediminibacillus albus TaxID=407036 RepID=A0A1G9CRU0_9BACI|nr:hypothetical protein [Sediminibacillus albus]SDK54336.1 hypothetical protein SAMN05216243_3503 [Sediminibacillus albus]